MSFLTLPERGYFCTIWGLDILLRTKTKLTFNSEKFFAIKLMGTSLMLLMMMMTIIASSSNQVTREAIKARTC